jgi:predicted deacylase
MEHIEKTIEELKSKVIEKEKELNEAKKMANTLCQMFGKPPLYEISDQPTTVLTGHLHGDEYYGRPLATVITTILEARKIRGTGPASVKEVYDQMTAGGYQFETKDDNNAMRGMRISMAKNPKFHKLPSGKWGLTEWYPNVKVDKEKEAETEAEELHKEEIKKAVKNAADGMK